MDTYEFDTIKEKLDRMNELLFYIAYPELKPELKQNEQPKPKSAI